MGARVVTEEEVGITHWDGDTWSLCGCVEPPPFNPVRTGYWQAFILFQHSHAGSLSDVNVCRHGLCSAGEQLSQLVVLGSCQQLRLHPRS